MRLFDVFSNGTATASGVSLMDRLSQQNGWSPDMRRGNAIVHFFQGDAITPRRDLVIVHNPGQSFATFSCACRGSFNARSMTTAQMAIFPARNKETVFGDWQIAIEDGQVSAVLRYTALIGGLDAQLFKTICLALLGEVATVEQALHGEGLL